MKKAHFTTPLVRDDNRLFGIILSDGSRVEHERGLDPLARFLNVVRIGDSRQLWQMRAGLNERPQRLAYYTGIPVREVNKASGKKTKLDVDLLYVGDRYETFARKGKTDAGYLVTERSHQTDPRYLHIASQWAPDEFSITAYSDEAKVALGDLNRALEVGDVYLRSNSPDGFQNTTEIAIFVASLAPDDVEDLNTYRMRDGHILGDKPSLS